MQECCTCGSVRGALGNRRPYRDTSPARRVSNRTLFGRGLLNHKTTDHQAVSASVRQSLDSGFSSYGHTML